MTAQPPPPASLREFARAIVAARATADKRALALACAKAWFARRLPLGDTRTGPPMPARPGRPDEPVLLPPREVPRRALGSPAGRVAFVHSLAHIELNAVDLMFDLIGRSVPYGLPRSYFDNFVQVGLEEAKHFGLLETRLAEMDSRYGALPAHDGMWQSCAEAGDDLLARIALVPLVLEARGLDVQPSMIDKARKVGDEATARVLDIIHRDEIKHVAFGMRWFRFACEREGRDPEPTFHALVRRHFRSPLKPPFNDAARSAAGLTPGFYKPLSGVA